jgi:hypothetical protein
MDLAAQLVRELLPALGHHASFIDDLGRVIIGEYVCVGRLV